MYVTGTKGKSTTSSIIGHLLRGFGCQALVGGNFGAAPYDPDQAGGYDYWVIEVSSYTAADLAVTPPVTAVTSLHPDHLPWHGDVERYYADKLSATHSPGRTSPSPTATVACSASGPACSGRASQWVSETDDPGAAWMRPPGPARQAQPAQRADRPRRPARPRRRGRRRGPGRQAAEDEQLAGAAAGFTPLPSRLTPVGTVGGVTFIDDSLSTNVLPTLAALDSFPGRRVALIVGGQDRGIDYAPLAQGVRRARNRPTF